MIAKGKSISHGTAALEYDLAKEINGEAAATEIHRHELFGCTGEEMVQEMKPYFVDFPNVKNNCLRFEVSPSVEESAGMTNADWAKLGNDFMQRMGLMNHQYIIVKHSGTEKNRRQAHLHILANRVSLSGELYKDNWIGKRATEAANSIARERNLVQSKDIGKANREEIKQAMNGVLARMQGFDLAGFSRELGKLGFKVREARASTGKLNGYYVEARSGTEYKASHNIKMGGVFTLPAAADGTGSWTPSDLLGQNAFTVVKNANITVNSNTAAIDISTNTPMLNIPQTLTAWTVSAPNKSKLEADNAKQCYLEITCKIRQSGVYLLGSASEYKTIYVPFGDTWGAGKRHIYTLIFGGGYTDQGEAVLNPIQFDAETTGWVDADNKDVNVKP